jgi:prepilin-type N-terminal cleavage/methylation domain-containing protein
MKRIYKNQKGFSLIELAIVLIIIGFLIAALLLPLQTQRDIAFTKQTEATLDIAKQALIGFAQVNGRLPCPATETSNGIESPSGGGACTIKDGFLPSATLGIASNNHNGVSADGWNNQIKYGVTQNNSAGGAMTPDFTTTGEMSSLGISSLNPDIQVICTTQDKVNENCKKNSLLINNAVAIVYSFGSSGLTSKGPDETKNIKNDTNTDTIYVSHEFTHSNENTFNHIVTWISPYVLYNAMIQAGQLH